MMLKRILLLCLAAALLALPVASLAETVVVATTLAPAQTVSDSTAFTPLPWDATEAACPPHKELYGEDNLSYHDDSIDVQISTTRAYDTTIMITRVQLADVSQFRTSLAGNNVRSQTTTKVDTMAKRFKAVLAINDDFCTYHAEGIVARNGNILRQKPRDYRDSLIVDKNGDFTLIPGCTQEQFDAVKDNVLHAFCFGPAILVDGTPIDDAGILRIKGLNVGPNKPTQRITISQSGPLQYVIIATEGPENPGSRGLTLQEMAQFCIDQGLDNAYNLDGGSSSTVVMNYQKVNSLSSGKRREVGGTIWFASLVP